MFEAPSGSARIHRPAGTVKSHPAAPARQDSGANIRALPGALKRWVRFAGRKKGLAADAVEETLSAIDAFAPGYRRAMDDRARKVRETRA